MGFILFTAVAGAIGGLLAWAMVEPMAPHLFADPAWGQWSLYFSMALGAAIAGFIGAVYGRQQGSRRHTLVGLVSGAFFGLIAATIGMQIGSILSGLLFPGFDRGFSATTVPGRILQLVPVGALIGMTVGVPARSWKQAVLGLIGGSIGGFVSGMLFDGISESTKGLSLALRGGDEVGIVGRALTSVILGFAIGLFVSLARTMAKTAWLRLQLGKNEGREWVVDAQQTFIGRNEAAHVPLLGDPSIAPMHACIVRQGPTYVLMDGGSPGGTRLNGLPIQQAPLMPGSLIQIGGYTLEFQMRAGSAPARAAEHMQAAPMGMPIVQAPTAPATPAVPSSPPAPPRLVVLGGPLAGHQVVITGSVEIGREGTGLALAGDAQASRKHARIDLAPSGVLITDLGSTNGTFVNGQRINSAALRPGDTVTIGNSTIRLDM